MKKILAIMSVVLFGLASCENEIDPGQSAVKNLSNEWWAQLYVPDGSGGLIDTGNGYHKFMTSGTASNTTDSLFVDDFGDFLELKAKVACNYSELSFTTNGTAVLERYTDGTVVIENGQVILKGGRSTSGVTVDSIYFEAEFDWDPGQIYIVAGHGRTGFAEDEH